MECLWTIIGVLGGAALLLCTSLLSIIFFEAHRRSSNQAHVQGQPIFEDPNSLAPVPCPSLSDPAQKCMSLIVPAFNEEHRLPGALNETMNVLKRTSHSLTRWLLLMMEVQMERRE